MSIWLVIRLWTIAMRFVCLSKITKLSCENSTKRISHLFNLFVFNQQSWAHITYYDMDCSWRLCVIMQETHEVLVGTYSVFQSAVKDWKPEDVILSKNNHGRNHHIFDETQASSKHAYDRNWTGLIWLSSSGKSIQEKKGQILCWINQGC